MRVASRLGLQESGVGQGSGSRGVAYHRVGRGWDLGAWPEVVRAWLGQSHNPEAWGRGEGYWEGEGGGKRRQVPDLRSWGLAERPRGESCAPPEEGRSWKPERPREPWAW